MPPALRRRATASASDAAPAAPKSAASKRAAAPKPKTNAASSGRLRRAAVLLFLAAAVAAAVAAIAPHWRAAVKQVQASWEAELAAARSKLPAIDPDAVLPPLPKRKFVEPTGGPVPADPANPTEEEIKAALGELGKEALPKVPSGASGYVTAMEWEDGEVVAEETLRPRLRAAVTGAFIADAATVGVHGVPGGAAGVAAAVAKGTASPAPAFLTPPAAPFPVEAGSFSPHGYQVLPLLQSMMARNDLDGEHYAATAISFFKNTPGHVLPLPATLLARHAQGLKHPAMAVPADVADALPKVAPLVARFGGTPRLVGTVEAGVRATQASNAAAACAQAAASVLERIALLGEGVAEAIRISAGNPAVPGPGRAWLTAGLDAAAANDPLLGVEADDDDSAPAALVSAVAVAASAAVGESYEAGVLAGATRGGAAAVPRAHLIGAWLAARAAVVAQEGSAPGVDPARPPGAPPAEWRTKAAKALQLEAMTHVLLYQRGASVPIAMAGEDVGGAEVVAEV